MDGKKLLLCILMLSGSVCFAQRWTELVSFRFGAGIADIGADNLSDSAYAGTMQSFAFDHEGFMYIADNVNKRLVKYGANGLVSRTLIENNKWIYSARKVLVDDPFLYVICDQKGIIKYDLENSRIVWEITKDTIPNLEYDWNYLFTSHGRLIYYPEDNFVHRLVIIAEDGTLLSPQQSNDLSRRIDRLRIVQEMNPMIDVAANVSEDSKARLNSISDFIDEEGRLYSVFGPKEFKAYAAVLRYIHEDLSGKDLIKKISFVGLPYETGLKGYISSNRFLGYDKDDLSYWEIMVDPSSGKDDSAKSHVAVFDQFGRLKIVIEVGPFPLTTNFCTNDWLKIDTDGNVYCFAANTKSGAKIYKYVRNW